MYSSCRGARLATRASLATSGLPILLVAADDAAEQDLARFAVDVPQTEVRRPGGVGHDVLVDVGPSVIALVADWLEANG
jgi:hypothetical protein